MDSYIYIDIGVHEQTKKVKSHSKCQPVRGESLIRNLWKSLRCRKYKMLKWFTPQKESQQKPKKEEKEIANSTQANQNSEITQVSTNM